MLPFIMVFTLLKIFHNIIKYHGFMIFIIILPNPTLLASLKNLVIGNGDSTYILCTPSWRVYIFDIHSSFVTTKCFIPSQALMFEVSLFSGLLGNVIFLACKLSFYVSFLNSIIELNFHLVIALVGSLTLLYIISQLYLTLTVMVCSAPSIIQPHWDQDLFR